MIKLLIEQTLKTAFCIEEIIKNLKEICLKCQKRIFN